MSSSENVLIDVSSRHPLVEFTLVDTGFGTVVCGNGRLRAEVPAGIYELLVTAGDARRSEIIALRPGSSHVATDVIPDISTITPADGPGAALATELSAALVRGHTKSGVLVVVHGAASSDAIELLDAASSVVLPSGDQPGTEEQEWSGWFAPRPPGGHILRFHRDTGAVDVPFWIPDGWQVVVFAVGGPHGADPAAAVVHLHPADHVWQPEPDRDVLLELLLHGLQIRRCPLPEEIVSHTRRWPRSPMTTIAAAVLAHKTKHRDFPALIELLTGELPGHPDVMALQATRAPLHWPPMFASAYWHALLPADHAGEAAISPLSYLDHTAAGLSSSGPYSAQRTAVDADTVAADRVRALLAAAAPDSQTPDTVAIAKATGLTVRAARVALAGLGDDAWRSLVERFGRVERALEVPGQIAWHESLVLSCTMDEANNRAVASLSSPSGSVPDLFPILLDRPGRDTCLLEFRDGTAWWPMEEPGSCRVRLPETDSLGDQIAYEAMSLIPEPTPAFTSARRRIRRQTFVPSGRFRMQLFENSYRGLELSVLSDDREDADFCALISVRRSGGEPEELAVPLTWLTSQGVATGALKLGRTSAEVTVFVVPGLVTAAEVKTEILHRSLDRFADKATERALRRAAAKHTAGER